MAGFKLIGKALIIPSAIFLFGSFFYRDIENQLKEIENDRLTSNKPNLTLFLVKVYAEYATTSLINGATNVVNLGISESGQAIKDFVSKKLL